MLEEFKSSLDVHNKFTSEEIAREYLENYRWNGTPKCPRCSGTEYYKLKSKKQPYCCRKCRKNYSVRVGTIFDSSNVPLHKWLLAMWYLLNDNRSISSVQMAKMIQVTQTTAWHMNHRFRVMFSKGNSIEFTGVVQVDEVYIGGKKNKVSKKRKEKMQQGSGSVGKVPVVGIADTETGEIRYVVAKDVVNVEVVTDLLNEHVSKDAVLVTDASPLYVNPGREQYEHVALNHSKEEFGRDGYHTNNVEGSFKHFRENLDCTFKGMVRVWHLQKYADEYVYIKNVNKDKLRILKAKDSVLVKNTILNPENLKRVLRYKELVKYSLNPRCLKKAS